MKYPVRLGSLGVLVISLGFFLSGSVGARPVSGEVVFGFPVAPFKKQSVLRDRLDSIQAAANASLESGAGQSLYRQLLQSAETNERVKKAIDLEFKMIQIQEQISALEGRRDSLLYDTHPGISQSQIEKRLSQVEANLNDQKRQLAYAAKSKKAVFLAKTIGASLTAVSLYFQVRNIKDAIRRVKIKELDLAARKSAMILDSNKLEVLNRKFERMRTNLESLQSSARAGAAELVAAEQALMDASHELDQWKDVMSRSSQKILDAEETALIDKRSIFRQKMSVGITTVGALVVSLFGDKIILAVEEWLESDDPADQEKRVLSFLQDWWKVKPKVIECSLLPSFSRDEVKPEEKAAVFFMTSQELGVKPRVLEKALARYKRLDPHNYSKLQAVAEIQLKKNLVSQFRNAANRILSEKQTEEYYQSGEWKKWRYAAPRDNTYVAPRVPLTAF